MAKTYKQHTTAPQLNVHHTAIMYALLVVKMPSSGEIRRRGERVNELRDRWRTLPRIVSAVAAWFVYAWPGTQRRGIVVQLPAEPRFTTSELLSRSIGKWSDVQLIDRDRIVAYSVREERLALFQYYESALSVSEGFAQRQPLSEDFFNFLQSDE